MPVWVVVVYGLAVTRLTGLITTDDITDPTRQAILRRLPATQPGPFLAALLTCCWCASIWVGFMVAPIAVWAPTAGWALYPAAALAFSQLAGMLAPTNRPDPALEHPDGAHSADVRRT